MTDAERRFTSVPVEVRVGKKDQMTIGGYAAKYNRISQNLGGFVEQIDPVFFNGSRGDGWPGVVARYNHDDMSLLGTSDAGTLRMTLDTVGLLYDVDLPMARSDVYELVSRGDVRQSSFAFITLDDEWGVTDQGFPLRTLRSGRLIDVAPVNTPAYIDTSVGLRSLAEKVEVSIEEVERRALTGNLVSFLKRTDGPKPRRRSPHVALGRVLNIDVDQKL